MIKLSDPNFDEKEIFLEFIDRKSKFWHVKDGPPQCHRYQIYDFVAVEVMGHTVFWNSIADEVNVVGSALIEAWKKNGWIWVSHDGGTVSLVDGHPTREKQ